MSRKLVLLALGVFLSLLTTCNGDLRDFSLLNKGPQIMNRQTRSAQPAQNLFIQGLRATRKILAGARRTPSADGRFKRFEKFGNINTAVKEFYSLKPRQVTRVELNKGDNVISGLVGDRQIRMYNHGDNGYPVIEIIDNNAKRLFEEWDQPGTYGEMIVYKQ